MTKLILTSLIATLTLFAYNAEVIKGDVTIKVNEINQSHKLGDIFTLEGGNLVCFVSGDGKIIIKGDKYSKKISKRSSCKSLPTLKKEDKGYLALANSAMSSKFGKSSEETVNGVSTRAVSTAKTEKKDITIAKETKYLILENKNWGPLPVTVKILDDKGEVVAEDVNEDDDISSFVFPGSIIKDGYVVKVINGFDELLVDSKVVIK